MPADCVSELDLGAVERQDGMPTVFAAYMNTRGEDLWTGSCVVWILNIADAHVVRFTTVAIP